MVWIPHQAIRWRVAEYRLRGDQLVRDLLPQRKFQYQERINDPHIDFTQVWYAAYGSNLFPWRLNWYIRGGNMPGHDDPYAKAFSQDPIRGRFAAMLPFNMGFGGVSARWGGAKGFLDLDFQMDPQMQTIGALYLMNRSQFDHVVWQENGLAGYPSHRVLPLERAMRSPDHCAPIDYPTDYDLLLFCGYALSDRENNIWHPVFTFTRDEPLVLGYNTGEPAYGYLRVIGAGLRSSTRMEVAPGQVSVMSDAAIVDYLRRRPGAHTLDPSIIESAVADHMPEETLITDVTQQVPPLILPGIIPFKNWDGAGLEKGVEPWTPFA